MANRLLTEDQIRKLVAHFCRVKGVSPIERVFLYEDGISPYTLHIGTKSTKLGTADLVMTDILFITRIIAPLVNAQFPAIPAKEPTSMKWYWKVRIYSSNGQYAFAEISTYRVLCEIDAICAAYQQLTGCKMLLEGMSEQPSKQENGFHVIWNER